MTPANRHLSLLVPALFTCPLDTGTEHSLKVTDLEKLLARSRRGSCAVNREALLFDLFGFEFTADHNLPIAPVTHALDTGENSDAWWLRADPVYMRADSDRVIMMGNDFLDITSQEAVALGKELDPLFQSQGLQLSVPDPRRWYLRLTDDPNIFWPALSDVRGHDIHQYLPLDMNSGKNAKLWRRILNESQMILHDSPVNHAREARGELPVNSLWFWGGGTLPQIPLNQFVQVCSNDALVLGLAKLADTARTAIPVNGTAWLAQSIPMGKHLVVVEAVSDCVSISSNSSAQKAKLEALNRDWFLPLLAALKSHQLASLHLYTGNGAVFHATSASITRWWKRTRSLAFYQAQSENPGIASSAQAPGGVGG